MIQKTIGFFALLLVCAPASVLAQKITKESIVSEGKKRTYYIYVPKSLPPSTPVPLVVLLHGSNHVGLSLAKKWNDLADKEGFIIVAPDSADSAYWSVPGDGPAFLHELVESIKTKYPISTRKVYLFGHSGGAVFALTYDMFVLLVLAAIIWTAVIAWTEERFEWRPLVYVILGTAAGLIINPYFPTNLHLFYEHLKTKLTVSDFSTDVGKEWYPYDSWEFLGNSIVACAAMLAGYLAFDPSDRKRAHHSLFFLVFSTALMLMTARWRRIAEYWPPFAVLFSAFALQPWLLGARSTLTRLSPDILDELQPFLDLPKPAPPDESDLRGLWQTLTLAGVTISLVVVLFLNFRATIRDISQSQPHDYYRAGAEWMRSNLTAGQVIFNTDWDDFPRLFYYDPGHVYVSGLDPTYLYDKDPQLSKLYVLITTGEEEDPGPLIRSRFGARFVFTDNSHGDFFDNARASGWFDVIYEDHDCTIFQIRDKKSEPEPEESNPDETGGEPLPDSSPQSPSPE